ncbi:hypothetical protein GYMLUDRAFT_64131 [Collybiopsis luxurians FD-317 M1]|uniref:polynucleotide adenylyltransferase n=1 Tax=Collybiopsis luxurians FD-317 M1 TaxID=944289 RepID=A0A0D0C4C2_9AGAR|nr:hypothetical protein GYMLUDRAFT_64131 [Collybiopsis luxurians FD-317 M1]
MDHPTVNISNLTANRTALVLVPPKEFAERLNPFRLVHDKAAPRWTAHITLHFSFVDVPNFPASVAAIEHGLSQIEPFSFKLDGVGSFSLSGYETVHLSISDDANIQRVWSVIAKALNYSGRSLTPHVTLGQAPHNNPEALASLRRKAQRLLESVGELEWPVRSVVFLKKDEDDGGVMKRSHEAFLRGESHTSFVLAPSNPTVHYDGNGWTFCGSTSESETLPSAVSIATYNILHDALFPISKRLPSLVQTIVSSEADIICFQEVTDDSLVTILSSPAIFSRFLYSSRHPEVVLENERNILLLSRYPFSWSKLDIGGKHKPAFLASFSNSPSEHGTGSKTQNKKLVLAATHLTAGRAGSSLEQKTAEMEALVNHMYETYPEDDWVLAGDMNWPENVRVTPADELFEDAGHLIPYGFTFDPSRNSLAAATMRESPDPQRYDRVYVKRNGGWDVGRTMVFGNGDDPPPSDHYGLRVDLRWKVVVPVEAESLEEAPVVTRLASGHKVSLPPTGNLSTAELVELSTAHAWLPSAEQEHKMGSVLETLRSVICPSQHDQQPSSNVQIRIECVGSYALGVHTSASDVDCLAVGNVSAPTFWELARSRIRQNENLRRRGGGGVDVKLRRFVKDAIVQRMDLEVGGIRVDMQYCPAQKLVGEEWKNIGSLPSDSPLFLLPVSSLITLNAYRDVLTLLKILQPPSLLSAFRSAHRSLKLFLTSQGLYGARFGFLGGFHLTLLLTRVALTLVPIGTELPELVEPHHLVRQFFATYAKWDWERDAVWAIPSREIKAGDATGPQGYRRSPAKEPMVVLSIERPLANLAFHASRNSVEVMRKAFQRADGMLEDGRSWAEACGLEKEKEGPVQVFLKQHKAFIKLDVHFWGGSNLKGRAVVGWLESRIVSLLVQLYAAAPSVNVRFWPARFVDAGTVDVEDDNRGPNGFYLFGLSPTSPTSGSIKSSAESELASITQCLRSFEAELQNNEKFYDSQSTYISLSLVKRGALEKDIGLAKIVPDSFAWSDNGFDPVDDDDDEELDEFEDQDFESQDNQSEVSVGLRNRDLGITSASQRKKAIAASRASRATTHTPAPTKLRTSADVMNRLLWDPVMGKNGRDEYAVGYEDRFLGIKESMLRDWVLKEVENEAFIPQHRIVYFKRVSDGEIIWDKRKKIDLVFGSGVGAG